VGGREEFLDRIQKKKTGPRILEELWEEDVSMCGGYDPCTFIIARTSAGSDTVGLKLNRN
jgi:hypothetical protein